MKKLFLYIFLGFFLSSSASAEKIKLKCQGVLEKIEGDFVYVNFDDKIIEVFQGAGGNKLQFYVQTKNEQWHE